MKKLEICMGTRGGYITVCHGKFKTEDYWEEKVCEFFACNATKSYLYEVYDWIESHISRVLRVLTSTGKTKIILVEDDFLRQLKEFDSSRDVRNVGWL